MLQKRATGEGRLPSLGRLRAPNLFHSIRKSNTTLQYRIVCSPPALSTSWDSSSMPFDENLDDVGPAASATMKMLEWNSLCEQVAEFASTHVGRRLCLALKVPESISETEALLHETRAMTMLEYDFSTTLDFGGMATTEADSAIKRAAKGGLCSTSELKGAVSLFLGAEALKKQIVLSARVHEVQAREAASRRNTVMKAGGRNSGDAATSSVLTPLLRLLTGAVPAPSFCRNVRYAIDDEGRVVDAASEALSMQRGRVRAAEARLASLLRGYQGEVSEQSGRMCVVMIAGTKMPPGAMLLGSSAGGSMLYVEPPAAVPLNNDLGAARAQAEAAEEDVLHSLTGQLMGVLTEAEACLQMVSRLDLLCAKARYGAWLGAELPDVVPWDTVFHSRGSGGVQRFIRQEVMPDASGAEDEWDDRYMVRLRSLRHPLLYGSYLKQKQALEKRVRQEGGSIDKSLVGSPASAARSKGSHRMLSTRRENMLADSGLTTAPKDGKGTAAGAGELTAQEQLAALSAPRPIDILIRRDTSAVIITGPNTGGKTAALKALGLTALMVRVGLPIPAEVPVALPAFSSVLADIGDEQSLTANLSTFSGHLKRIQALRAEADGKALVLLDELGTGTDPTEGAALGVALLRKMVSGGLGGGALIVATTHHSIMTGLKFEDQRFENASVEFDEVKLAPTYKLLWGIPGRSNALNIAERLGLDSDVVGAARQRMDTGAVAADSVITQLELLREKSEALSKLVMAQEQEIRTLVRELELMEQEVDFKRAELGQARKNSLFEVWSRARERLKAVKEMKKKRQQGRLPSGVTLESLIGSQVSTIKSASSASSLTASVEEEVQVDSLEDAYRELEQLVRPSQEPSPEAATAGLQERSLTGSAVLTIADYHEKDVSDVFDDLAGLYQRRMEVPAEPAELTPGEVKYMKVVNAIEDFILDADTPGILQTAAGELDQDFMELDVKQALSELEAPSTVQNQQSIEEVGEDEDYLRLVSLAESTMLIDDSVKQAGGNHGSKGQHSQSPSDDGGEDGILGDDDMAAFVSSLESMQISPYEMKDEDEVDLASALLKQMEVLEATASSSSVRDGLIWSVDQQSKSSRSSGRSGRSGIGTNISTVADGPRMYSNFGKQPRYNEPADESREGDDRMEQSDSGYSREREEELDLDALVSNLEEDLLTLQAYKLAGMSESRASKGQSTSIKKAVHKTKERKTNA